MLNQKISFVGDPGLAREVIIAKIENSEVGRMLQSIHNNLQKLDKARKIGRRNVLPIVKNIITVARKLHKLNIPLSPNVQRQCSWLAIV